jgi:hypothetical protein
MVDKIDGHVPMFPSVPQEIREKGANEGNIIQETPAVYTLNRDPAC